MSEDKNKGVAHGGPSSYYDYPFKEWVTTNDMLEYLAMSVWGGYAIHFKDIVKASFRWGTKEGTSLEYDARKIVYSGLRLMLMVVGRDKTREYLKELLNDKQFGG